MPGERIDPALRTERRRRRGILRLDQSGPWHERNREQQGCSDCLDLHSTLSSALAVIPYIAMVIHYMSPFGERGKRFHA
jgi:hypothetical protein